MSCSKKSLMNRHIMAHEALVSTYLANPSSTRKLLKQLDTLRIKTEKTLSSLQRMVLCLTNSLIILTHPVWTASSGPTEEITSMPGQLLCSGKKGSSGSSSKKPQKKSLKSGRSFRG